MKRAAVLLVLAVVAACTYTARETSPYQPPGLRDVAQPTSGAEWFARDCAWCHGARGEGTPRAPDLIVGRNGAALTDFVLRTGRMPIQDPAQPVERGVPAYSEETIRRIAAYVAALGGAGPGVPTVRPMDADLALGQMLYQQNCAACHSATAVGGTLTQGKPLRGPADGIPRTDVEVPGLQRSTAVEIAEAMLTGPGTMPVFGDETFSADERDAVVRYVLYLQTAGNRGGADLARIGPVAEGAVAWIVGLGGLLLLALWIGRRSGAHD